MYFLVFVLCIPGVVGAIEWPIEAIDFYAEKAHNGYSTLFLKEMYNNWKETEILKEIKGDLIGTKVDAFFESKKSENNLEMTILSLFCDVCKKMILDIENLWNQPNKKFKKAVTMRIKQNDPSKR